MKPKLQSLQLPQKWQEVKKMGVLSHKVSQ